MQKRVIALCFLPLYAGAATQHEINLGLSDVKDASDQFIGVKYRYYLSELDSVTGANLINPYLQRVSSVTADYFSVDQQDRYNFGATWYIDEQWMLTGDVSYTNYGDSSADRDYKAIDLNVGYNLSPQWQIGAGAFYQRLEYSYPALRLDSDPAYVQWREASDNELSPGLFARYTQIDAGTGWDIRAEATFGEIDSLELAGRYFFSRGLSVGATYTHLGFNSYNDQDVIELDIDYWFRDALSLRFGLGVDVGDGDGLASATVLATYRF